MSRAGFFGRLALLPWLCALLLACVQPMQIAPGTPAVDVMRALGQPSSRHRLPDGGQRLQYSSQPAGQTVYNVDLDARARVTRVEQALNEMQFGQRIRPNVWTRADVLREYGPPAYTMSVHNFKGTIWVWRYLYGQTWRLLYIDIDPGGVVRGWSNGDENIPDSSF
ncbi:MAG: hypothetical protein LBE78_07840 [Burkholderiaceae bacterium]|jgi:hypothetical protein|nr:hypothetical protein [Burkholderiaceae bacterium]